MKEAASKQIESILKDYHWMMNSIKILRDSMKDAGEELTAQYGDEAGMPKAKGSTSDPVYRECVRREKRYLVIHKYETKISIIQDRMHLITDDREMEVLHWLLEGKSYRWIAMHMGLSHTHIGRIKDSIVKKMSEYVPNVTSGTNDTKLIKHKSAC
ncbi:LuxR C-terminal-related transcriptional regulator [Cytobacillus oceanisediminis]|uniref:LuxR C-terminal-related transcriptional regulator n=1 Tax=Cytobacillus oceanisediminis TaxID=665099 RepID=UPI001C223CA1|nr:LuxR C-terminal-related transcriptional regulator [Cytobacillus oceanisediminis]MBU8732344.1 DNA-binding response regulator [Cytobacillus oceanisediminis]MDK7666523.1 LuxR C-terminal-related transcriptional regulator [Cytobacillus oceanisediminis]